MPAATAAAAPPDDPAAEIERSHGLCVTPSRSVSVLPSSPNSEAAVFPAVTSPASSIRATYGVRGSGPATFRANTLEPQDQRRPGYGVTSFTRNGTPANGPAAGRAPRTRS